MAGYTPEDAWAEPFRFIIKNTEFAIGIYTLIVDGTPFPVMTYKTGDKWLSATAGSSYPEGSKLLDNDTLMALIKRFLSYCNAKLKEMFPTQETSQEIDQVWKQINQVFQEQLAVVDDQIVLK